ncbi:MAG: PucR family transcriptional regulator, partial [Thermoleophilaceae bacterium]
ERLLAGRLSEHELALESRRAGLSASGRYVAVALDQAPPNAISLEALGAVVERAIGGTVRSTVVGRTAAIVTEHDDGLAGVLQGLEGPGFAVHAGVSEPAEVRDLAGAWEQAREALALRRMAGGGGRLAFFRDLGPLHLLAQVPRDEVLACGLFQRLAGSLSQHGSPSDIDVLEVYLSEGTLRRAAARVYLHHTSIENRLKRIQEDLDVDLRDPVARFEVNVVLKVLRILQARDASRPVL